MNFSNLNCNFFRRFYNAGLSKYLGLGNTVLSYRDLLMAYLNINSTYITSTDTTTTITTTNFVGVVTPGGEITTTPVSIAFYYNDQDAFDNGVAINDDYYLSADNTYGLPFGTRKKLVEDVE